MAQFLYDWQTLIAGVLAVLAAAGIIWATIKSANREIAASQAQTAVAQKQIETCSYARGVLPRLRTGDPSHDAKDEALTQLINDALAARPA
jgi:hypothetical protein